MNAQADTQQDVDLALESFLAEGGTFAMLKGVSAEELEQLYTMAYGYYQSGKLEEAQTVFKGLCVLNHYDSRFFLGLGACRQALKHYDLAIQSYVYGALVDIKEPRFPFHAAECHLQSGDLTAAESGFYSAHALAQACPGQDDLAARAALMLEHVVTQRRNEP
ncbi:Chaperone protein SicA [compost metagenome]